MKENERFILDIKRLGINGEGIGFYNKLAVFVKNAIPGEGIDVEVTKVLPKMAFAKAIEWKKVSPSRVEPKCMYYERCGACQVMHIDNKKMGEFKREAVIEALKRYTKLNPSSFEIKSTIVMEEPYNYRNKSTLIVRREMGKNAVAMIEENSNRHFAIKTCLVQDEKINEINAKIIALSNHLDIKSFGCEKYSWRYLVTRVTKGTRESLVCLVVYKYNEEIAKFADMIVKEKLADSVYVNINADDKTHEIFGPETIYVGGKKSIIEKIDKYKFNIYPTTFFQLNTKQTEVLYAEVKKAAKLTHQERVLDAFCGVGTIASYVANVSKEVIGIEYNKEAIEAAKENLALNKIKNVKFYQGNTAKLLPELISKDLTFDVAIFDPPRTGLGEDVLNTIMKSNIKRIVYVSCNPSTLAKDLAILANKYKIRYIQPVDMFPQTSHVESITLLDLKK